MKEILLIASVWLVIPAFAGESFEEDVLLINFRKRLAGEVMRGKDGDPDLEDIRRRSLEFLQLQKEHIRRKFDHSLKLMPRKEMPAAEKLQLVLESDEDLSAPAEHAEIMLISIPQAKYFTRMFIGMTLPMLLMKKNGWSAARVSNWLSYFSLAEAEYSLCGGEESTPVVCLNYGNRELLRLEYGKITGNFHIPQKLSWYHLHP